MNRAMNLFCSFDQNNKFLGNGGTLKIGLLQCYGVLWIHNIDAICLSKEFQTYFTPVFRELSYEQRNVDL